MRTADVTRLLRRRSTPAEALFWELVRGRRFRGIKFYRQHPLHYEENEHHWNFIADFYCREQRIIEIDGPVHDRRRDYDLVRTRAINSLGLRVIRFRNEEVENNPEEVLQKIEKCL